jgi:hypothetical protein
MWNLEQYVDETIVGKCKKSFSREESYTSKSSFLDDDPLPEYKPEQPYTGTFSGKRISISHRIPSALAEGSFNHNPKYVKSLK